jgi:hypothetical protein
MNRGTSGRREPFGKPPPYEGATATGYTTCEETVSLGNVARSTTSTRYPFLAKSMAVGEPAQRAPKTIASYAVFMWATSFTAS